jgi:hypothetical protein
MPLTRSIVAALLLGSAFSAALACTDKDWKACTGKPWTVG